MIGLHCSAWLCIASFLNTRHYSTSIFHLAPNSSNQRCLIHSNTKTKKKFIFLRVAWCCFLDMKSWPWGRNRNNHNILAPTFRDTRTQGFRDRAPDSWKDQGPHLQSRWESPCGTSDHFLTRARCIILELDGGRIIQACRIFRGSFVGQGQLWT